MENIREYFIRLKGNILALISREKVDMDGEDRSLINSINIKYLYIISAALFVFLAIMGIFLSMNLSKLNKTKYEVPDKVEYEANIKNYIYLDKVSSINGNSIKLIKMLPDSIATAMYFDKHIDLYKYKVSLVDENNKNYMLDYSFIENNNDKCIRFENIDENSKEFILKIEDNISGDSAEFSFELRSSLIFPDVKYLDKTIYRSINGAKISLDNAIFSASGTTINYTLQNTDDSSIVFKNKNNVKLEEGYAYVVPNRDKALEYDFGNTKLYRMDYEGISNISAPVHIEIDSIYKKGEINEKIDLINIIGENNIINSNNYSIEFGKVKIDDEYIQIMYNAKEKNKDVGAIFDANIVIGTSTTFEIPIKAVAQNGVIEASLEDAKNFFDEIGINNISIDIESIYIKQDNISFDILLDDIEKNTIRDDVKKSYEFIQYAFNKRLEILSQDGDRNILKGIYDKKVIKDEYIIKNYYENDFDIDNAQYKTNILAWSKTTDENVYAVVQDYISGEKDGKPYLFSRIHLVNSLFKNNQWVIYKDQVVR